MDFPVKSQHKELSKDPLKPWQRMVDSNLESMVGSCGFSVKNQATLDSVAKKQIDECNDQCTSESESLKEKPSIEKEKKQSDDGLLLIKDPLFTFIEDPLAVSNANLSAKTKLSKTKESHGIFSDDNYFPENDMFTKDKACNKNVDSLPNPLLDTNLQYLDLFEGKPLSCISIEEVDVRHFSKSFEHMSSTDSGAVSFPQNLSVSERSRSNETEPIACEIVSGKDSVSTRLFDSGFCDHSDEKAALNNVSLLEVLKEDVPTSTASLDPIREEDIILNHGTMPLTLTTGANSEISSADSVVSELYVNSEIGFVDGAYSEISPLNEDVSEINLASCVSSESCHIDVVNTESCHANDIITESCYACVKPNISCLNDANPEMRRIECTSNEVNSYSKKHDDKEMFHNCEEQTMLDLTQNMDTHNLGTVSPKRLLDSFIYITDIPNTVCQGAVTAHVKDCEMSNSYSETYKVNDECCSVHDAQTLSFEENTTNLCKRPLNDGLNTLKDFTVKTDELTPDCDSPFSLSKSKIKNDDSAKLNSTKISSSNTSSEPMILSSIEHRENRLDGSLETKGIECGENIRSSLLLTKEVLVANFVSHANSLGGSMTECDSGFNKDHSEPNKILHLTKNPMTEWKWLMDTNIESIRLGVTPAYESGTMSNFEPQTSEIMPDRLGTFDSYHTGRSDSKEKFEHYKEDTTTKLYFYASQEHEIGQSSTKVDDNTFPDKIIDCHATDLPAELTKSYKVSDMYTSQTSHTPQDISVEGFTETMTKFKQLHEETPSDLNQVSPLYQQTDNSSTTSEFETGIVTGLLTFQHEENTQDVRNNSVHLCLQNSSSLQSLSEQPCVDLMEITSRSVLSHATLASHSSSPFNERDTETYSNSLSLLSESVEDYLVSNTENELVYQLHCVDKDAVESASNEACDHLDNSDENLEENKNSLSTTVFETCNDLSKIDPTSKNFNPQKGETSLPIDAKESEYFIETLKRLDGRYQETIKDSKNIETTNNLQRKQLTKNPTTAWKRLVDTNIESMISSQKMNRLSDKVSKVVGNTRKQAFFSHQIHCSSGALAFDNSFQLCFDTDKFHSDILTNDDFSLSCGTINTVQSSSGLISNLHLPGLMSNRTIHDYLSKEKPCVENYSHSYKLLNPDLPTDSTYLMTIDSEGLNSVCTSDPGGIETCLNPNGTPCRTENNKIHHISWSDMDFSFFETNHRQSELLNHNNEEDFTLPGDIRKIISENDCSSLDSHTIEKDDASMALVQNGDGGKSKVQNANLDLHICVDLQMPSCSDEHQYDNTHPENNLIDYCKGYSQNRPYPGFHSYESVKNNHHKDFEKSSGQPLHVRPKNITTKQDLTPCSLISIADSFSHHHTITILPPNSSSISSEDNLTQNESPKHCTTNLHNVGKDSAHLEEVDKADTIKYSPQDVLIDIPDVIADPQSSGILRKGLGIISKAMKRALKPRAQARNSPISQENQTCGPNGRVYREPPDLRPLRNRDSLDVFFVESETDGNYMAYKAKRKRRKRGGALGKRGTHSSSNKKRSRRLKAPYDGDLRPESVSSMVTVRSNVVGKENALQKIRRKPRSARRLPFEMLESNGEWRLEAVHETLGHNASYIGSAVSVKPAPDVRTARVTMMTKHSANDPILSNYFGSSQVRNSVPSYVPYLPIPFVTPKVLKIKDLVEVTCCADDEKKAGNVDPEKKDSDVKGMTRYGRTRSLESPSLGDSVSESEKKDDVSCESSGAEMDTADTLRYSLECLLEVLIQRGKVDRAFVANFEGKILAVTNNWSSVPLADIMAVEHGLNSTYAGMITLKVFEEVFTCMHHGYPVRRALTGRSVNSVLSALKESNVFVVGLGLKSVAGSCLKEMEEFSELLRQRGL